MGRHMYSTGNYEFSYDPDIKEFIVSAMKPNGHWVDSAPITRDKYGDALSFITDNSQSYSDEDSIHGDLMQFIHKHGIEGFDDLLETFAEDYPDSDLAAALKNEGESKNQSDDKYDLGQLTNGTFVETEHTDDLKAAKEIAKDHLEEDPQYYSKGDFPEEAEEAKDKIISDENCKDKACSDGNKKDMPGDFKNRVLSDRRMKLIRGFAESFGGAR